MIRESRGNVRRSNLPVMLARVRPVRLNQRTLRGLNHAGYFAGLGSLGFTLYDLIAASGMEDCDPRDSACVMRNAQRDNAAVDLWTSTYMQHAETADMQAPKITVNLDTSQAAYNAFMNNQPMTSESITVNGNQTYADAALERAYMAPQLPGGYFQSPASTPGGSGGSGAGGSNTPPATTYRPVVAFANVTSGNGATVSVGDKWRVTITGGAPNAAVTVTGGKGSTRDTSNMGKTDAAGAFTMEGTVTAGDVGQWFEDWKVAGTDAGSFTFNVPAPTTAPTGDKTPAPTGDKTPAPTGGGAVPGGDTPAAGGLDFTGLLDKAKTLPWYVWAGAAGGLYVVAGSRGRR